MTREELSLEEYSLSRVINTSEKNVYTPDRPTEDNLETYFRTLFQLDPYLKALPIIGDVLHECLLLLVSDLQSLCTHQNHNILNLSLFYCK